MVKMELNYRLQRSLSSVSIFNILILVLLLLRPSEVDAFSFKRAAVVAAAPVATPVVPPKAAVPPVVAIPPKAAVAPAVVPPKAAPAVIPPKAAPAPVVVIPPVVAPPVVAPVAAKAPAAAPKAKIPPVVAPVVAPAKAPVAAKPPAVVPPVAAPVVPGPDEAPTAPTPAGALAPSTGVPLDAAQVKALIALGIPATADACSTIALTTLKCDRNATTQHIVALSAQDCPSKAIITPASLAVLTTYMTDLSFINCGLQDTLPEPTDSMETNLESFTLRGAPSPIPGWWIGRLKNLKTVHVADTYVKATGLSVIISDLTQLTELTIANSSIQGGLPTEWPAAATLTSIDLSGNQISGPIPLSITKIPGLTSLDLSRNRLSDHIISGIGNLDKLTSLDLSDNLLKQGIPKTFSQLIYLQKLDLSHNKLNGTIPEELGNLPLTYLDLSNNTLSGYVPFTDEFLAKLEVFKFAGNKGLCYNSTITSAKAAGAFGLRLCGAPPPAEAPLSYGPAAGPEVSALDSGDSPTPKKKPNVVVIVFATLGSLIAVAAIVYCCCRYWGAKAGYE